MHPSGSPRPAVIPLLDEPDDHRTAILARRSLGPWTLRRLAFALGSGLTALFGWLALSGVDDAVAYGHLALILMPLLMGVLALIQPLLPRRRQNAQMLGLSLDQWASVTALNALAYSLTWSVGRVNVLSGLAVVGGVLMVAASTARRLVPAFAESSEEDSSPRTLSLPPSQRERSSDWPSARRSPQ
jgi:hypothetical protein